MAQRAADYAYDIMNVGEAARALNIVFTAAQKLSSTPGAQRVLEGAVVRASDDTFAIRLLAFTEQRNRNKILTDFSNVDVAAVKRAFIERMRERYGSDRDSQAVDIAHGDWHAFRSWAGNSEEDREIERGFWRRFTGQSRKRLAQAINFVFPDNLAWEGNDPIPAVNSLFPTDEFKRLIEQLPEDEQLDEVERKGISRMQELLAGKYRGPFDQ